jgi:hypothetical protein
LDYRTSFGAALGLMQQSAQLMSAFLPRLEMQEAQNKLEAFRLFAFVDQQLRFPAIRPSLLSMVCRAQPLPPWQRNFALEGVANFYTSSVGAETLLTGLLADPELPETAMVPMHAGMGNAVAEEALSRLGYRPSQADLREALEGFFERCYAASRPGWHENAIEAIGLAVRTLHPHLLKQVSEAIGEMEGVVDSENAQRLFWHGVGRALYFVPMNFMTFGGSHERGLRATIDEASTLEDRRNTVAGFVWAVTLVNIRQPAVLRSMLRACRDIRMPAAVSNGIVSALMVWKHMVPFKDPVLVPYLGAVTPMAPESQLWNELVALPVARAFAETLPALTSRPAVPGQPTIASLFQYHEAKECQAEVRQAQTSAVPAKPRFPSDELKSVSRPRLGNVRQ